MSFNFIWNVILLLTIIFITIFYKTVLKRKKQKDSKNFLIIGIAIAILGIVIFTQRDFFVETFLGSIEYYDLMLQLVAYLSGVLFIIGLLMVIKGVTSKPEKNAQDENTIFCSKCGKKLDNKTTFCPDCGKKID